MSNIKNFTYTDSSENVVTLCVNLEKGKVWAYNQYRVSVSLSRLGLHLAATNLREQADIVFNAAMEAAYSPNKNAAINKLKEDLNLNFVATRF